MRGQRKLQAVVCFAALSIFGGAASATNISLTGSFATDDQLESFTFTLASSATVVARTWSYAGGTNAAGTLIPAGGFDPWLSIFDAAGNLQASVDNRTCGQVGTDPVTGSCFDSYISQTLGAGAYTLILSESDNQPAGTTLADGFTRTGQGNFTAAFGCSNGQFCDINADNRTPNWAVDIDNVTSGPPSGVPEPAMTLPVCGALGVYLLLRRKRASV